MNPMNWEYIKRIGYPLIMLWLSDFLSNFQSRNLLIFCFTCLNTLLCNKPFLRFHKLFPAMKFLIVLWKFVYGNYWLG